MKYHSMMDLLNASDKESKAIWEIMLEEDCIERLVDKAECFEKMRAMYKSMKEADATYDNKLKSASGMAGGDGEKCDSTIFRKTIFALNILRLLWRRL